jgi:hypothetical protein
MVVLAAGAKMQTGGMVIMVMTIFIFFSMNGIVAAASTAAALDNVPSNMAGSASALIGSLQYGSGIVSSLLLSAMSDGTPDDVVDHDGFYTTESGDGHQTKNSLRKSLFTRQSGHCPCLTSRGQI